MQRRAVVIAEVLLGVARGACGEAAEWQPLGWKKLAGPLRLTSPSAQIIGGRFVVGVGVGKPLPLTAGVYVASMPGR